MKIQDFFQELGAKPYDKFACSSFRSIDGAIFVRRESGGFINITEAWGDDPDLFPISVAKHPSDTVYHTCEPYWVLGAVIEDDVLLTHNVFDEHRTGRNVWQTQNARQDWVRLMGKDRVRILVKRGEPPVLKPHSRILRNRYGMIKDILLESMGNPTHSSDKDKEDLALLMPAKEWWGLAWAYAITNAAKRVVDCDTKIASSLTKVSFDNLTNLDAKLTAIREKVSASDFKEAKKLFVPLEEQVDKLQDLVRSASHQITSAGMGMAVTRLPDQLYRLTEDDGRKHRYLFDDSYYSAVEVHARGTENLLGSYDSLSALFNKIGVPIPTPYGVEICPENMGQLAVLNDTIKEIILTSPRDEAKTEDNEEPVTLLG